MSKQTYSLKANPRQVLGKGASRRLRRKENLIPGIIYGGSETPQAIQLCHNEVTQALRHEGIYSHILALTVAGKEHSVVLKDMQRHPYKPRVLHMDFLRVSATEALMLHVPLHFVGEANCPGVKAGGVVTHQLIEVEVKCLPKYLPEFLEVDLSQAAMDSVIHLSDIPLPPHVELVELLHQNDRAVVSIHRPRVAAEETVEAEEEAPAAAAPAAGAKEAPKKDAGKDKK